MALSSYVEGWAEQPLGKQARILLVHEDLRELTYYHAILQELGCKVRACSSFAEGVRCLGPAKSQEGDIGRAIRDSLPNWPRTITLDRLLAELAMTQSEVDNESVAVKNDPPKILYSSTPAVLILIDGQPVLRAVPGTSFQYVINTPATLIYDTSASRYYLDGNGVWVTAATLEGPWTVAANPPSGLDQAKAQIDEGEEKDPHDHSKDPGPPPMGGALPAVFVSTTPAELLVTQGAPQLSPIPKTKLLYVTNTENNIFLNVPTQIYYVLLSGRWYQSKSLTGPWTWVSASQIPSDFAQIPPDSPKGAVLASVPGTEQAREAVIANQNPANRRGAAKRSQTRCPLRRSAAVSAHRGHISGIRGEHLDRRDSCRCALLRLPQRCLVRGRIANRSLDDRRLDSSRDLSDPAQLSAVP